MDKTNFKTLVRKYIKEYSSPKETIKKSELRAVIKECINIILKEALDIPQQKPYKFIYVGAGSGNVYGASNAPTIEQAWNEFKQTVVRMSAGDASDAEYDRPRIEKNDGYWGIEYPESDEGAFFLMDINSTNPIIQREIQTMNLLKYADEYLADKQNETNPLAEMTTTGDVGAYNIPSAFSRKGGSHKGVAGSAKLGYNLTPIGKKDMNRQSDSLNESVGNANRVRLTIKKNSDTSEWMVKVYINGKYSEKATYYTDDKADAVTTGGVMKSQYAARGFIV